MKRKDIVEQAKAKKAAIDAAGGMLTDEQAVTVIDLYDEWAVGVAYAVDEYLTYGINEVGDPQLYKVVQAHTSQADWTPNGVPALFTAIGLTEEGYPVWAQPTGAHDAYGLGAKVSHNNKQWVSTAPNNIWEPGVYGWEEVV